MEPLRIETPLGTFSTALKTSGAARAKCVARAGRPRLPPGMRVEACTVLEWTVEGPLGPFQLACERAEPKGSGGPSSGEGVEAFIWRDDSHEVALGTESADFLASRAREGAGVPRRWVGWLEGSEGEGAIRYQENGLTLDLPSLESGETCVLRFVVAWSLLPAGRDAAWFAIDLGKA